MIIVGAPTAASRSRSRRLQRVEPVASTSRMSLEWIYFSCVIAAWCFTPFIRRLVDYGNGAFNPVQVTSLIPFVMLLPLVFLCFRKERVARIGGFFRFMSWLWVGVFSYGFLVAFAVGAGSISAAAFTLVEYLVPMLAGIWLVGQGLPADACLRRISLVLLPCAGIVAFYGLIQWVQPPPWDVMWVRGANFQTVGLPEPFVMRVFSTLNSPGPAGDFIVITLLLMLPYLRFGRVWIWPLVSVLGVALLLTLVREAWIGLIVGTVAYLMASPRRLSAVPVLAGFALLMVALAIGVPPLLGSRNADVITSRVSSMTDVSHDESALDRQDQIVAYLEKGVENPVGSGLGLAGAASKLGPNASVMGTIIDSGYLTRLLELGWLGTLGYLMVVLGGPLVLAQKLFGKESTAGAAAKVAGSAAIAVCAFLAWGDAADEAHLGVQGFFFWVALGLGSLAIGPAGAKAVRPARNGSARPVAE